MCLLGGIGFEKANPVDRTKENRNSECRSYVSGSSVLKNMVHLQKNILHRSGD